MMQSLEPAELIFHDRWNDRLGADAHDVGFKALVGVPPLATGADAHDAGLPPGGMTIICLGWSLR